MPSRPPPEKLAWIRKNPLRIHRQHGQSGHALYSKWQVSGWLKVPEHRIKDWELGLRVPGPKDWPLLENLLRTTNLPDQWRWWLRQKPVGIQYQTDIKF